MIWNDNMFVSTTFVLFLTRTVRFWCSSVISCCTFVINVQCRYFGNTNYCNIHVALLFDDTQGLWLYNNDNKDINVYVYWALYVLRCMADHWICVYCIAVVNTSVFKWNLSLHRSLKLILVFSNILYVLYIMLNNLWLCDNMVWVEERQRIRLWACTYT